MAEDEGFAERRHMKDSGASSPTLDSRPRRLARKGEAREGNDEQTNGCFCFFCCRGDGRKPQGETEEVEGNCLAQSQIEFSLPEGEVKVRSQGKPWRDTVIVIIVIIIIIIIIDYLIILR